MNLHDVKDHVLGGDRPKKSPTTPPVFQKVMMDCWNHAPKDRPTFVQLFATLRKLGEDELKRSGLMMRNLGPLARGAKKKSKEGGGAGGSGPKLLPAASVADVPWSLK